MQYPIFIHKDADSDYGVIVPDLPGCYSAGATLEKAMCNAQEAIFCHVEGLLMDGDSIPLKQSVEHHLANSDFKEGVLALVEVDLTKITGKCRRINISLPEHFLKQIDNYTKQHGNNRSGFLVDAALNFMAEQQARNAHL